MFSVVVCWVFIRVMSKPENLRMVQSGIGTVCLVWGWDIRAL